MSSPTETLNLPENVYEDYTQPQPQPQSKPQPQPQPLSRSFFANPLASDRDFDRVIAPPPSVNTILHWINDLNVPNFKDIALMSLVKEVIDLYRRIYTPYFSHYLAHRVYNIFLLFQTIAHHPDTRGQFLKAYPGCAAAMPYYFFPFMNLYYTDKPRECLRLGALVHMLVSL